VFNKLPFWTRLIQLSSANPLRLIVLIQLLGFSGPSHIFSQDCGTVFLSSEVASLSIIGVSISVPLSTPTMLVMLSLTFFKI
jgi:hypothetical protein